MTREPSVLSSIAGQPAWPPTRAADHTSGNYAMTGRWLAVLALMCVTALAHAQNYFTGDLARRTIERRAVEAVNWGMPAVNTDLMLQEMLKVYPLSQAGNPPPTTF